MSPRQVRRGGVRPTYGASRPTPIRRPRPAFQLPVVQVAWLRLAVVVVVVGLVLAGLGRLTRLQHLRIIGNHTLTTAHVTQLAKTGLHHQWFGGNTVLLDGNALVTAMENAEPGIKQITITRTSLHAITITIVERQPTLNWKTGTSTYLLDANGAVIGPTQGAYAALPTVTDSSNLPVKVGDRVAPTQFIGFCSQLAQLLPGAGYQIASMTVPASTSEVYVATTSGLTLKFDTTRPAGDEIADLKQVQAELASAHKNPTQYIDLRIPHKAYYE